MGAESPLRFPAALYRTCVEWVRLVERAALRYAAGDAGGSADLLGEGRRLFAGLQAGLEKIAAGGGSRADLGRLDAILEAVERACRHVRSAPSTGGGRPAFETITQTGYAPGDQAGWQTEGPASGWSAKG